MRIILITILLSFQCSVIVQAQEIRNDTVLNGSLNIYQDSRIDSLMKISAYIHETDPHIDGFRIEIFFESGNNSHKLALEEKSRFVQNHSEVPVYLTFQAPNYKVRVGDFRTRLEAEAYLQEIKSDYPGAWVVAERIQLPKLKENE